MLIPRALFIEVVVTEHGSTMRIGNIATIPAVSSTRVYPCYIPNDAALGFRTIHYQRSSCFGVKLCCLQLSGQIISYALSWTIAQSRHNLWRRKGEHILGRPYQNELKLLAQTYSWAKRLDLESIRPVLFAIAEKPLLVVGSGGSLSAAHLAATLHERRFGQIARACTPLELSESLPFLSSKHGVLILSAGGRNADVIGALQSCVQNEVFRVGVLCGTARTPLARMARSNEFVALAEFSSPAGKDGFLAVNSLMAFAILLSRVYSEHLDASVLPESFEELLGAPLAEDFLRSVTKGDLAGVLKRETLVVLYGPDTKPAAIDLESKFTEAALGRVQLADFRNFGHGRHHWLAKRARESGIVALCGPEDFELAKKTIALLPREVPHVLATFGHSAERRQISALVYAIAFTGCVGEIRGIDPGKPGVPDFGRKIYHLKSKSPKQTSLARWRQVVVKRKFAAFGLAPRSDAMFSALSKAMDKQIAKLGHQDFRSLVLDYDGTLCTAQERFDGPSQRMSGHLSRLLDAGVLVGIATGRGDSVRADLRRVFDKRYWAHVWIGYHNGGEIGRLDDESIPPPQDDVSPDLQEVKSLLEADAFVQSHINLTYRHSQITLRPKRTLSIDALWAFAMEKIKRSVSVGIRALSSTHSVDVVASRVSKMNLLDHLQNLELVERGEKILCLGDRGRFPGNDFELLAHEFALSVDEVSGDIDSGWNLAPPGCRGILATLHYMALMKVNGNRFTLDLSEMLSK